MALLSSGVECTIIMITEAAAVCFSAPEPVSAISAARPQVEAKRSAVVSVLLFQQYNLK